MDGFSNVKFYTYLLSFTCNFSLVLPYLVSGYVGKADLIYPFKQEAYLFYMTQCVPRCKHSPLRL
jgi:hypothetical protein